MGLNRRSFVRRAFVATGAMGASALSVSAIAQERREVNVVCTRDRTATSLYTGESTMRLFDRIEQATQGGIIFSFFDGEVPEDGEFEIASSGNADGYYAGEYHWNMHHVLYRLFGGMMPMGMSFEEFQGWFYHRGGEQMWHELSNGFNIKAFMARTTGPQCAGWFTEEIRSVDDFVGKRVDMPGGMGYVMERMGALAEDYVEEGPIVEAMKRGEIFAAEKSTPAGDMPGGYHTGVDFFYPEIIHEPHPSHALGFNLDTWNSFTPLQQKAIQDVCMGHYSFTLAESMAMNAAALEELRDVHGVRIMRFPRDVMLRISELSAQYVREEIAAVDDLSKRVVDSYIEFRSQALDWAEATTGHFIENRRLPYAYTS